MTSRIPVRVTVKTIIDVDEQLIDGMIYQDRRKVVSWCIGTRDAQVRSALIELGWTPPKQHKKVAHPYGTPPNVDDLPPFKMGE
jgi:hypothetical protein